MLNNTPESAVKSLNNDNLDINASIHHVKFLVDRYMTRSFMLGVTAPAGVALLRECYERAAGDLANQKVIESLSFAQFNKEILSEDELTFLSKQLNEVFQKIITGYDVKYAPSLGFIQPQEVTDFMCALASFPKEETVYNPFAGADSFAVALPNPVEGEEISNTTWALGQIRLFAMGASPRTDIRLGDSFVSLEYKKKYKAIISSPAYLTEKGKRIEDIVGLLYDKLEEGGTLVCLVSSGFLFSGGNAFNIRKRLIDDKALKAVINIPNNIFTWSGVRQAVLVITKGLPNEYVIFADASGYTRFTKSVYRQTTLDWEQFLDDMYEDVTDFGERGEYVMDGDVATAVNYPDIIDTNLLPEFYLSPKPKDGLPLSELASIVKESREDGTADYFIVGSSLPEALHRKPYAPQNDVEKKGTTKGYQVAISDDAVLLSIVSGNIRTVYVEDFQGTIAFPNGFVKVLKPAEGVSAKYLAALLSTKIVADQIKALTAGLTIPRLNKLDLTQIMVPDYKSDEDRQKVISEVLSAEMSDLESELNETFEKHKREVRSTRHAMVQTLSALSSNWEQLKMFAKKKGGQINFTDTIGRVNPITVENLLTSIGYAISTLERQVDSLRFEKADWGEDVEINPFGFINEYISTHSTPNVKMVNVGSDNSADIPDLNEVTGEVTYYHTDAMNFFYAPKRLLERVFNNIVANAKAHGFTSESEYPEIRFDWQEVNGDIVITVANNGLPLKDGVTSEDVLMSGFSTSLNEIAADGTLHSGQGGFEIKSLMEGLGSVEILSEPDTEFPVIYKLTFTNTNTVRIL